MKKKIDVFLEVHKVVMLRGEITAVEKIGLITHFFNHIDVAVIQINNGELKIGDNIHIVGAHIDFAKRFLYKIWKFIFCRK